MEKDIWCSSWSIHHKEVYGYIVQYISISYILPRESQFIDHTQPSITYRIEPRASDLYSQVVSQIAHISKDWTQTGNIPCGTPIPYVIRKLDKVSNLYLSITSYNIQMLSPKWIQKMFDCVKVCWKDFG